MLDTHTALLTIKIFIVLFSITKSSQRPDTPTVCQYYERGFGGGFA